MSTTISALHYSSGLRNIDKWIQSYSSNTPSPRYDLGHKLLQMSTIMNTSILKYDSVYKDCIISFNNDKDINEAGSIIVDFYLYKDKKYFDVIVKCFPNITDTDIGAIISSKRRKFVTVGKDYGDVNMFIIYYNFSKFKNNSRFPVSSIVECQSKIKEINPDTYITNFVSSLVKEVS